MGYFNSERNSYHEIDPPAPRRGQRRFWLNLLLPAVGLVAVSVVVFTGFKTLALQNPLEYIGIVLQKTRLPPIPSENVFVKIGNGLVLGKLMNSRAGREYLAFLGMPYAKPPVAHLRFEVRID